MIAAARVILPPVLYPDLPLLALMYPERGLAAAAAAAAASSSRDGDYPSDPARSSTTEAAAEDAAAGAGGCDDPAAHARRVNRLTRLLVALITGAEALAQGLPPRPEQPAPDPPPAPAWGGGEGPAAASASPLDESPAESALPKARGFVDPSPRPPAIDYSVRWRKRGCWKVVRGDGRSCAIILASPSPPVFPGSPPPSTYLCPLL